MTYKQKLIDLLKSDDETKTVMEKLEFGCRIFNKHNGNIDLLIKKAIDFIMVFNGEGNWCLLNKNIEIIGLPLQERFIRMYCENKGFGFSINCQGGVIINNQKVCESDNTKDFDNQDDEVYQKIYEVINNLITK